MGIQLTDQHYMPSAGLDQGPFGWIADALSNCVSGLYFPGFFLSDYGVCGYEQSSSNSYDDDFMWFSLVF